MTEHQCKVSETCTCSRGMTIVPLEPDENCPVHGVGPIPPRCGDCGRFLPHTQLWLEGEHVANLVSEQHQ